MKIVHINTWDNLGGAARAAYRLHTGLRAQGVDSRMLVGWRVEQAPEIDTVMNAGGGRWQGRARGLARRIDHLMSLQYALLPWSAAFLEHPYVRDADIIHLHNLHGGYFPYRVLPRLAEVAPVVWSLHDMWAATGHCGYAYDCDRWRSGCGRCPNLEEAPAIQLDLTALHWRLKDRVYRRTPMDVVTGSEWMAGQIKQSPLLNRFAIHTVPYGSDLAVFRPVEKAVARRVLRIPSEARVILVFAVTPKRKGVAHLLASLEKLDLEPRPWLLVVGNRLPRPAGGFPVREVGYVHSDDLLNLCYAASDILVLPTLAENLPLSVLDGFAAGTPAVAYAVGGVPEIVRHNETGYLVPPGDLEGLTAAMRRLLTDDDSRHRMAANARATVEAGHSLEAHVKGYLGIYEEMLTARVTER